MPSHRSAIQDQADVWTAAPHPTPEIEGVSASLAGLKTFAQRRT